jgi:hypothetical protein
MAAYLFGPLPEGSPLGGRPSHPRWALRGPCAWWNPRVRVWGTIGLPLPPLADGLVGAMVEGVSLPPPHLYKGTPRGRGEHKTIPMSWDLSCSCISTPLSPLWLLEGLRRSEDYSTAARHRATGILRSNPNRSNSTISAGSEIWESSSPIVCVRVLGGATFATPESLHQDPHDLEVGYVGFMSNACAGA